MQLDGGVAEGRHGGWARWGRDTEFGDMTGGFAALRDLESDISIFAIVPSLEQLCVDQYLAKARGCMDHASVKKAYCSHASRL